MSLADVTLPSIISDHMVLQRNTETPLWGWATPGQAIEVETSWGAAAVTETDARGGWMVHLATPDAGGPHTITIRGRTPVTLRDVLVGEVWICSGQSNMAWPLARTDDAAAVVAAAGHPTMRLFTVANTISAPRRIDCEGAWAACTPETAAGFSAVGYYFGRTLQDDLDVPIGLISADWGGTVVEAWMSESALAGERDLAGTLAFLRRMQDPNRRGDVVSDRDERWWDALDGDAAGWIAPGFDDEPWLAIDVPATWSGELGQFDGVVMVRTAIELDESWADAAATLELGPIDDYDDAWINGTHVGATHEPGRWNQPRRYAVPAGVLVGGRNVVAVRVLDTGGLGGINGAAEDVLLRRADGETATLAGTWRARRGAAAGGLPPRPSGPEIGRNTPTVLFNGMIAPIIPFAKAGVIWYQGESNRPNAADYRRRFPGLIRDWRSAWGSGMFPFYFVQIAPYAYTGDAGETAMLREAQAVALQEPETGMVVTLDVGDAKDIHPTNKKTVGERLAALALAKTYERTDMTCGGPTLASMTIEGTRARLAFEDIGGGLVLEAGTGLEFLVAGADRVFVPARVRVDDDTLVVTSPAVEEPVAVRYGWWPSPEATLFNAEGWPAAPFRTDDWSDTPAVDNSGQVERLRADDPTLLPLFNGVDLGGWVNVNGAASTWQVRDGVIACSGTPTGVLRTERQYENFVLELEWRHLRPLGNAGVFVWSDPLPARGQPYTRGIEVQVLDGQEGSWYTSDGDIFPIHGSIMTPENGREGSRAFPTERRSLPAPLWNHYRIECRDGVVELAVNGVVVTRGRECSPRKGYICLESEGSPIEFRAIRLKELSPGDEPLRPSEVAATAEPFTTMYTGVDFTGWKHEPDHAGHWTATDWRIVFDGAGPDLWSERSYRDFELICDWRWTGEPRDEDRPVILPSGENATGPDDQPLLRRVPDAGDSGIYLRGSSKSQVNIWCWPIGSGEVYGYRTDPEMPPAVRAGVTPDKAADAPIGQWNRFRITMKGDLLTVNLNGETVIDEAQLPGVPATGPIALQSHGGAIEFANIFIRELE